jgi:hypothetical protein
MISKIVSDPPKLNCATFQDIASEYTPEKWFENFKKTFGP